ncbi:CHASE3 domain-containing protein [Methylocapsa palsarum]|uniref:histidine kinase n=1 Tax=Methylocapsa palsarum TaxID=1612308 RepID=A0A1I3VZZ8_9HYPH|nr:CHASE3 domain-containing protein [Methylocapsa palsarum]SFJ99927.1 PAS domain S-box-containing protein [Methylocapsa palsarum]
MNRRLSGRVEASIALALMLVPLAFLALIGFLQVCRNAPEAKAARTEMAQRLKVMELTDAIDSAVRDAESGQRGFLITGSDKYLEPYERARQAIPRLFAELRRETLDKPGQQRRLAELQTTTEAKVDELVATIKARREQGYEAAKAIVETDVGRETMIEIETLLKQIQEAAAGRLQKGLERSEAAERQITATSIEGGVVAALALLAGAWFLSHAYRKAASSERILLATLDSVREGVATFDADDRLLAWNAAFTRILGIAPDALARGANLVFDPITHPAAAEVGAKIVSLREEGRRAARAVLVERKTTDARRLEIFHNPLAGDSSITTLLDVTERRRADEMLLQTGKLQALGQMTGGVAHDFNNLLTIVIGCVGMLREAVGGNSKALERIEMTMLAAERGARLTKQLLAFARRQPLQPEVVAVGPLMTEILPLVLRAVGETIEVECISSGGLWNTIVDPAQFQSAVLNLAINARDAMPDGGKLTIEAVNASLDDSYAARHAEVEPGQYVMFAITDTGLGMDEATKSRALDPFFTTKPVGEGTGLGLPQVYGFVKQSGGHIKIYSEAGEGTTVKLYLPRSDGQAVARPIEPGAFASSAAETVLLADDDEIVRATVAAMLESLGYNVLTAAGGSEALKILEEGTKIDLLFTDVVMPGPIGGRKLAELARAMIPGLKVLFTSGYTENAIVHNGRLDPGVELISKPYTLDRLAAKLRRVLDAESGMAAAARVKAGGPGE